jgi:hypothetical protein
MWDIWNSDDPATLIFKKDGRETVLNFWPVSMSVEIRQDPIRFNSTAATRWFESAYRDTSFNLKGMVDTMIWDAEVRYLKEKFTQKRIDIVNIDPALKWQPKAKVA